MFHLDKFSLIIITRCNLKCRLCCEFVPQNTPFPDMTADEAQRILDALFQVVDHVGILHLTGGGEPFLHPHLAELIDVVMKYSPYFDKLMLFTNSTIPISENLLDMLKRYSEKILVQVSHYHQLPEREAAILQKLKDNDIHYRLRKYYGEDQTFGGWIDYGPWNLCGRTEDELEEIYHTCFVTAALHGNWRTRDGKVHWCSRSQRGMDLGLIPDQPEDYVDLFDSRESVEQKREKFIQIEKACYISACNYCSGEQGKRYPAAEQMKTQAKGVCKSES